MELVNRDRSRPFITKDGSEIRSILDRTNSTVRNQSLAEATIPPGMTTEEHCHRQAEEIYYVLRGGGIMTLAGEQREIGPGDGILIPPGSRHMLRNTRQEPLVILCCCAPPYSHEDTVLVASRGGA